MICKTCYGGGVLISIVLIEGRLYKQERPCPNLDCHAGQVHCCDGLREQPEPAQREDGDAG